MKIELDFDSTTWETLVEYSRTQMSQPAVSAKNILMQTLRVFLAGQLAGIDRAREINDEAIAELKQKSEKPNQLVKDMVLALHNDNPSPTKDEPKGTRKA